MAIGIIWGEIWDESIWDNSIWSQTPVVPPAGTIKTLGEWLASLGFTGIQVNDAFHQYMDSILVGDGAFNDRFVAYLRGLGYSGSLPDMVRDWNFGQ